MLCGKKDARGIVDPDHLVARGMQYEQSPAELADFILQPLHLGVLHERAADTERPAGQLDFGLAFGPDPIERTTELPEHVRHIGRRADCHDRLRLRNAFSGRQHGSSSRAASSSPLLPGNVALTTDDALMARPRLLVSREAQTSTEIVSRRKDCRPDACGVKRACPTTLSHRPE